MAAWSDNNCGSFYGSVLMSMNSGAGDSALLYLMACGCQVFLWPVSGLV